MQIRRAETRLVVSELEVPGYGGRVSHARDVVGILGKLIEDEAQEVFVVLVLNTRNRVQAWYEVSRGTLSASLVHPREVFGPALRLGAAAIIAAHNHPSGDAEPSHEDEAVTTRLHEAGTLLGVPLLDHVVIGSDGEWTSMRERMEF